MAVETEPMIQTELVQIPLPIDLSAGEIPPVLAETIRRWAADEAGLATPFMNAVTVEVG